MNPNSDDWDDTLLLQIFNNAIQKHQTKKQEASKVAAQVERNNSDPRNDTAKEIAGKRKRGEENPQKQQSFQGMMDSYYTSRTRSNLLNNDQDKVRTKSEGKITKVQFAIPENSSSRATASYPTSPLENTHFVENDISQSSVHSSQPASEQHPLVNDALQNMLMAWYQSGYATARYETLVEFSHLLPPTTIVPVSEEPNGCVDQPR